MSKGITPAFGDEDILVNGKRPDRWTDLYAVGGIACHVLTGNVPRSVGFQPASPGSPAIGASPPNNRQAGSLPNDDAIAFQRALRAAQVPAEVVRIIVKARTKRDDRLAPEDTDPRVFPSALAAADAIHNWREGRVRRAAFIKQSLVTLALLLLVGLPGLWSWLQWNEARQASNLVAGQRMIDDLRQQFDQFPQRVRETVASLRDGATQAERKLNESQSHGAALSERLALADAARSEWRRVLKVGREIERGTDLQEAIGLWLEQRPDQAEFWVTAAPTISQRLTVLGTQFRDLTGKLQSADVGETDGESGLVNRLSKLLAELKPFMSENEEARKALLAKLAYEREKGSVAPRVQKLDEFIQIDNDAQSGAKGFVAGEFKVAKALFDGANGKLTKFLDRPGIETSEEKQNRQRVTVELVSVLEAEKTRLASRVTQLTGEIDAQAKHIAEVSQEQSKTKADLKTAQDKLTAVEPQLAALNQTKATLTKATSELAATQKSLTEQQAKLRTIEPQLVVAKADLETEKKRADKADEQVRQLIAAADRGNEEALKRAQEIAALNTKIAQVDTKQLQQAEDAFAAARENYGKVLRLRDQFVANDKPKPTSKILEGKNQDVAVAQEQMEAAFEKLEAAHVVAFNVKQPDVAEAQQNLEAARAEYEDGSPKLDKPKQTLATAKATQQPFAAAAARASGAAKKLTTSEIVALAGVVPGLPRGKVFTDKNGNNYVRIEAVESFLMGAPEGEAEASSNEKPQHKVGIPQPLYFGEKEETQAEFQDIMGFNPSYFSATGGGAASVKGMDTSKFPVESVSWFDNCEYANRKSLKNGLTPSYRLANVQKDGLHIKSAEVTFLDDGTGFRMPKEAEWEYAARAGTNTPFYWGSVLNGKEANVDGNYPYGTTTKGPYLGRTSKVGAYAANPFGIYDTVGNVWEPCQDTYDAKAYASRGNGVTVDPMVNIGNGSCVFRGGSWNDFTRCTRAADRAGVTPDVRDHNSVAVWCCLLLA